MTAREMLNIINRRSKELVKLTEDISLTGINKAELKRQYRFHLNIIKNSIGGYTNDPKNYKEFVDIWNKSIKKAQKLGVNVKIIESPNPLKVMKRTINNLLKNLTGNSKVATSVFDNKVNFIDDFVGFANKAPGIAKIPRITLLQAGAFKDDLGRKVAIKFPKTLEKDINSLVRAGLNRGDSPDEILKNMTNKLNTKIPNDHFYYKTKKGFTKRSLTNYGETYIRDLSSLQSADSTIASNIATGNDLIVTRGASITDPLCLELMPNQIRSLSGRSNKFPIATAFEPAHPNCNHITVGVFDTTLQSVQSRNKLVPSNQASLISEFSKVKRRAA